MSDTKLTLKQKLLMVQKNLDYFKKDTEGYKYSYVSGASILGKVKKLKDEFGLLLFPIIGADSKIVKEGDDYIFTSNGFMQWSDNNEDLDIPFFFTGKQNDPSKAFGSALTYSERYFLLKYFGLPTDEIDPDKFQEKMKDPISGKVKSFQEEIVNLLRMMYKQNVDNFGTEKRVLNSVKKHLGMKISSLKDLKKEIIKCVDEEKLDTYSEHLVYLIEKHEAKGEENE